MEEVTMSPFRAWVAWHPIAGKSDIALSRQSCEQRLTEVTRDVELSYEKYIAIHESELSAHIESGWQIIEVEVRPVEGEK